MYPFCTSLWCAWQQFLYTCMSLVTFPGATVTQLLYLAKGVEPGNVSSSVSKCFATGDASNLRDDASNLRDGSLVTSAQLPACIILYLPILWSPNLSLNNHKTSYLWNKQLFSSGKLRDCKPQTLVSTVCVKCPCPMWLMRGACHTQGCRLGSPITCS